MGGPLAPVASSVSKQVMWLLGRGSAGLLTVGRRFGRLGPYLPLRKQKTRPAQRRAPLQCGCRNILGSTLAEKRLRRRAGEGNRMSASDSNTGFRQRLLKLIDRSGVSDRQLSLLATGSSDTVRNMRRGSSPRLDSLEALCRVLGFRLEMVPLDEPGQPPRGTPFVEKRPEWSRRLREEIRQDLAEMLGRAGKRGPGSNRPD